MSRVRVLWVQGYERAWQALADATGLPPSHLLEVRGNHDAFDVIRGLDPAAADAACTSCDRFMRFSAAAAAGGRGLAAERFRVSYLPASAAHQRRPHRERAASRGRRLAAAGEGGVALGAQASGGPASAELSADPRRLQQVELADPGAALRRMPADGSCPALVLVSVDAAPEVGLHR
jgi:hypothetical protein